MITIPGGYWLKGNLPHNVTTPAIIDTCLMNATGEMGGLTITVPRAGTLHSFEFRSGTMVNVPDNGLRLSFQNVEATAEHPDGVADQFRDITTGITANTWLVPPGPITSDGTDTGTKRTVVEGDRLALIVAPVSFVASDSIALSTMNLNSALVEENNYYRVHFQASWGKGADELPIMILKYTDGYEYISPSLFPILTLAAAAYNIGTTPDEKAFRFKPELNCELSGISIRMDMDGACNVILYDAADSVLWTGIPTVASRVLANSSQPFFPIPNIPLTSGAVYRIAVKPTTTTNLILHTWTAPSNAYFLHMPFGIEGYLSTRTDAGAWTDVTNERPWIDLRIGAVDSGSGGGASSHLFIG